MWRGDSHYGRVEAMDWADEHDNIDYIFGLAGNAALDALVAETADNLRFHHAKSSQTKLRTYASFTYRPAVGHAGIGALPSTASQNGPARLTPSSWQTRLTLPSASGGLPPEPSAAAECAWAATLRCRE